MPCEDLSLSPWERVGVREENLEDPSAVVFEIQRYSIHDGPGIRTLVFLKGCPLRCLWCCNPESQSSAPEIRFLMSRCARCGTCVDACPEGAVNPDLALAEGWKIDRVRCTGCGKCAEVCPNGAMVLAGKLMSVSEVVDIVKRDARLYRRSGGGLTLSGGEPFAHADFAEAVLRHCYDAGIHTAVETSGAVRWESIERALPYLDLVLFDLKHMDERKHEEHTGVSNRGLVANLRALAKTGKPIVIRVPLVPGYNTDRDNLLAMARLAREVGALEVDLMPFHQLGKDKYRQLDRPYPLGDVPDMLALPESRSEIAAAARLFEAEGLKLFVGG